MSRPVRTHVAWDRGAVLDALGEAFGADLAFLPPQKTTKAMCGRRVRRQVINNDGPSCQECRKALCDRARGMLQAFSSFPEAQRDERWLAAVEHCREDLAKFR